MKNGILTMLAEKAKLLWRLEQERPLQVSVMGQTGVGKSSLVNALFGANFRVSSTRPETLASQMWKEERGGHTLEFWDLPGLGETSSHDERYIEEYTSKLLSSNIVLWAVHADSRSFSLGSYQERLSWSLYHPAKNRRTARRERAVFSRSIYYSFRAPLKGSY